MKAPPLLADRRTWIYFIQAGGDGPIKIGVADDPRDRLKTLQQGSWQELCILTCTWTNRSTERHLHAHFADARLRGEWFLPVPSLLALIEYERRTGDWQWEIDEVDPELLADLRADGADV